MELNENLFGDLWQYIIDDNVTDIKWNGFTLWIDDLNKGRYLVKDDKGKPKTLSEEFIKVFTSKVANDVNRNFNLSEKSLNAELGNLRIQAVHNSASGDDKIALAIRKTPSVSRLANTDLVTSGYTDEQTAALLPCLMRSHLSGIITGDVGSGKTELEKYLIGFINDDEGILTVEDTLEMKIHQLYPLKDVYSIKTTDKYTNTDAIKDALRLMIKWLILAEARGEDIVPVMEAASTGCCALVSIHAENVWELPDRIMNMNPNPKPGFENDIYTFFDYAIKVKKTITKEGIKRNIDQLCFFDRQNGINKISLFIKDGKLVTTLLPTRIIEKFTEAKEDDFMRKYSLILHRGGLL